MSDVNFEAIAPEEDVILEAPQPAVAVRKRSLDVYTVMLIISFVCLVVGTLLLWSELGKYNNDGQWPWKTGSATPRLSYVITDTDSLV